MLKRPNVWLKFGVMTCYEVLEQEPMLRDDPMFQTWYLSSVRDEHFCPSRKVVLLAN